MIALAEHHKIRLGSKAEFRVGNLHDLACFSSGTFDLVFSSTVTHYLDIDIFFKECWNVLRTGGILLLSIIHPIYTAQYPLQHADGSLTDDHEWEIRYLEASLRSYVQPWVELSGEARYTVTSYHYTFSDYFRALLGSGFDVTGLDEPMPPPIFEQLYPERYQSYLKTPTFALIRAIKPS
jgi:SAM-dependent methyltransferase